METSGNTMPPLSPTSGTPPDKGAASAIAYGAPPSSVAPFTIDEPATPAEDRFRAAHLKEGLLSALADLRSQNSELSTHIDVLGKETQLRAESESAIIESIRSVQGPKARQLPSAPMAPAAGDEAQMLLDLSSELRAAQRENKASRQEARALRRETSRKDRQIADLKGQLAPTGVRDEFKLLLQRRCEELETQLKRQEGENSILLDRVAQAEDKAGRIGVQLQREEIQRARSTMSGQQQDAAADEARPAARPHSPAAQTSTGTSPGVKPRSPGAGPDVMLLLQLAMGERDEAVAMAEHAERSRSAVNAALNETRSHTELLAGALRGAEGKIEHMSMGFEKASKMMVQYSAKLESELREAQAKTVAQSAHIARIEEKFEEQSMDMQKLIGDLDNERFRVAENAGDGAVTESISLMRMKQEEHSAHEDVAAGIKRFSELTKDGKTVSQESQDILREIKEKVEACATLPPGWEAAQSPEGLTYYIDHNTTSTSWVRPTVGMSSLLKAASGWIGEVEMARGGTSNVPRAAIIRGTTIAVAPAVDGEDAVGGYIDINPDDREFIEPEGLNPGSSDQCLDVAVHKKKTGLLSYLSGTGGGKRDDVRAISPVSP